MGGKNSVRGHWGIDFSLGGTRIVSLVGSCGSLYLLTLNHFIELPTIGEYSPSFGAFVERKTEVGIQKLYANKTNDI